MTPSSSPLASSGRASGRGHGHTAGMGSAWNALWLTAAFVSEIAALVALGYWGFTVDGPVALRILLSIGAPAVAAALWGIFAAPRALVKVRALALLVKVVVFGSAVGALVATGHP